MVRVVPVRWLVRQVRAPVTVTHAPATMMAAPTHSTDAGMWPVAAPMRIDPTLSPGDARATRAGETYRAAR
jgi:hypothetical protein